MTKARGRLEESRGCDVRFLEAHSRAATGSGAAVRPLRR